MTYAKNAYSNKTKSISSRFQTKLTRTSDTNTFHATIAASSPFGESDSNALLAPIMTFAKVLQLDNLDCYDKNI